MPWDVAMQQPGSWIIGLEGNYGIAKNTWATAKYLSADAIYGAPYSVDVFQLDLNTRF